MGTVMDTAQDTRPVAAVIPLPRPAAPTPPPVAGSVWPGGLSAREVLALTSRQADQLAATIEAALAAEDARHACLLQILTEQHQQRRHVLIELADALGQQCTDLDEATATMPATSAAPVRMFGFVAGDRVRDPRTGRTGRVRFHALDATERAEGHSPADVVWDGSETVTDLELAVAHGLDRAPKPPR